MLTYNFENLNIPLYEHIYRCIKSDILSGKLSVDEKLPSKRAFAENNGISVITVQNAYEQLIDEGYIYALPKRGYYISDLGQGAKAHTAADAYAAAENEEAGAAGSAATASAFDLSTLNTSAGIPNASGASDTAVSSADPDDVAAASGRRAVINLSDNRTDPARFPFSVWAKLMRRVISDRQAELMTPAPTGGVYELRKAIAGHLKSFRGVSVEPERIIVGAGTEYLYGLLIQLLGTDKTYCIENPGYKKLSLIYEKHGVQCVFAGMDEHGILTEELETLKADIAHISPTHHFPTGISMPASRRCELLAWAASADGRYIIEDDYDSEFRQNGRPVPPLIGMDVNDRVIYMNTFSKSLTPTIRISYMVLPRSLVRLFRDKLSFYSCTVSNFEQYTLAGFIGLGYFEKHINRMRLFYLRQRSEVLKLLQQYLPEDKCTIIENDSGLHFILELKTGLSDSEIKAVLLRRGIEISALSDYYLTESPGDLHRFIINYSNIKEDELLEAVEVLGECL